MSDAEGLVVLATLVALGLSLSLVVDPPLVWVLFTTLEVVVAVGTTRLSGAADPHQRRQGRGAVWMLPVLLVLGAWACLRLPVFAPGIAVAAGALGTTAILIVVVVCERWTTDGHEHRRDLARLVLDLVAYVTAFALFSAIFSIRTPDSIFSATPVFLSSGLVCMTLMGGRWPRRAVYSAVIGMIVAQIAWALDYWAIDALGVGLVLLLALYVLVGLAQSQLRGRLSRRLALEYGLVGLAGLGVALGAVSWTR